MLFSVEVEGTVTASPDIVRRNSGLTAGKEVTGDDIQSAIRRLWNLRLFSDVQISIEKEVPEGVYLLIRVGEYPRLERVELIGNKKIKKDEISDVLALYDGQVITPHIQNQAAAKIKKLYHEKGFLLATVTAELKEAEKENSIVLRLLIDEGKKVKIGGIFVEGNERFSDGTIRKQMKGTKEKSWWRFWRKAELDLDALREDEDRIVEFYRNHGYRDMEFTGDSLSYSEDGKRVFVHLYLRDGPKYHYGDITWEGQEVFEGEELSRVLGIKRGDAYNKEEFEKGVYDRVNGLYMDRGYLYVQIMPREIPVAEDTVDVHFTIAEGQQVRVRSIHIVGNSKTKEKVIRRELKILPGDVFSRSKLIRSQREVFVLNYFSNVVPEVLPVDEDEIDLEIRVEEKQTDVANASAGYSQRDKAIGTIGVDFNNFLGNGQRLSFNWQFGRVYRSISIGFTEPWLFDTPTLAGFRVFDTRRRGRFFPLDQAERGGSVTIGRRFRWPDDYFRGSWRLRVARREFSNITNSRVLARIVPPKDLKEFEEDSLKAIETLQVTLVQVISRDSRDRPEFPTKGSVVSLTTQLSGGPIGGGESFHKHVFKVDWYSPAWWQLVLFNSFQFGVINRFSTDSFIPWDEFYFMGGSALTIGVPLRGYGDRRVGAGALGGASMLKYTTELRFPLVPNPTIFGLLFAEAGNTWLDLDSTDPFDLRRSAGFGLRMFMPLVGLIGFDIGYGFDDLDGDGEPEGWTTHFQFGQAF